MPPLSWHGPFRPGTGGIPPYLAGREREQQLLRGVLADLAVGVPTGSEIILYGPRGNGKTVLLAWLEREVANHVGVEVARHTPSDLKSPEQLAEALLPDAWWERRTPSELAAFGMTWRPGRERPPGAAEVLEMRAGRAPLVLLLDEAHTLDPDTGRALLNASQRVGRDLPFLLVLAGTPNLRSHLNRMGVSFWNRAELVRIERLADEAAADALRRPFEDAGISVAPDALEAMVSESQCYPFFVQLLGSAVWRQTDAERRVTLDVLDRARPDFEEKKGEYYLHRFDELDRLDLLGAGRAVAETFRTRRVIGDPVLKQAIGAGLAEDASRDAVRQAAEVLSDLGFIWRARARPEWEPGIPSLMDYVREFAPAA